MEIWVHGLRRKIWTWEWLLKRNERGAHNGILNELRLTDKEDFRKYLRMNTSKRNENNFLYHISFLLYMVSQNATLFCKNSFDVKTIKFNRFHNRKFFLFQV